MHKGIGRWHRTLMGVLSVLMSVSVCSLAVASQDAAPSATSQAVAEARPPVTPPLGALPWYNGYWPQDNSDLLPDQNARFGKLANGFRYVILPHQTPKGTVSICLDVQVGSAMEGHGEHGLAHFVDIMSRYGSKHVAPGTLANLLHSLDLRIGVDAYSETSQLSTVYGINLPTNQVDKITQTFNLLRDVADGLTFPASSIDVVRQSLTTRTKSANAPEIVDTARRWRDFLEQDARLRQDPLSIRNDLSRITQADLVRFYNKWYNPSRMVLVVVGDVSVDAMQALIEKTYGDLKNAPMTPSVRISQPSTQGVKALVLRTSSQSINVRVNFLLPRDNAPFTLQTVEEIFMSKMLDLVMFERIEKAREQAPKVWANASFIDRRFEGLHPRVALRSWSVGVPWQDVLAAQHTMLAQLAHYGVTRIEFNRLKKEVLKTYERQLQQFGQMSNGLVANHLIQTINGNQVFMGPERELGYARVVARKLSYATFQQYAKSAVNFKNCRILVSGQAARTTAETVEKYWRSLSDKDVVPTPSDLPVKPAMPLSVVVDEAKPINIVWSKVMLPVDGKQIALERTTLPNGLSLALASVTEQKGKVVATLLFGNGLMGIEDSETPKARFAVNALSQTGVGNLSTSQTSQLLIAHGMTLSEGVNFFSNYIEGTAPKNELGPLLDLMVSKFLDPVITPHAYQLAVSRAQVDANLKNETVEGVMDQTLMHYLTGWREITRPLSLTKLKNTPLDALNAYLKQTRMQGDRTLLISGDFDVEAAKRQIVKSFGTLPPYRGSAIDLSLWPSFPQTARKVILVSADHRHKLLVTKAWEIQNDSEDGQRQRVALQLASQILVNRLNAIPNNGINVAAQPKAWLHVESAHRGFAYVALQFEVKRGQSAQVQKLLKTLSDGALHQPVTQMELDSVKGPALGQWRQARQTNQLWNDLLIRHYYTQRPTVTRYEAKGKLLESMTRKEVTDALRLLVQSPSTELWVESSR